MKHARWLREASSTLVLMGSAIAAPATIRVTVIDSVGIEEQTLSLSMAQARRIFNNAGLELEWISCRIKNASEECIPAPFVVRIIARPRDGFGRRTTLGFSVFAEEGSVYATIFRDRVSALATVARVSEPVLLGAAIAHELGHLLLGNVPHARQGIMAWPWTRPQLDRASVGLLRFEPMEIEIMRAELARR